MTDGNSTDEIGTLDLEAVDRLSSVVAGLSRKTGDSFLNTP